jgi:hypothetical protein
MRGGGHLLHVHPHAAAYVQQQQHVDREIFMGKIANRDQLSVLAKDKVLLAQSSDRVLRTIHDQRIDPSEGDIAAENGLLVIRGGDDASRYQQPEPYCGPHSTSLSATQPTIQEYRSVLFPFNPSDNSRQTIEGIAASSVRDDAHDATDNVDYRDREPTWRVET